MRILIVEDNYDIRNYLLENLRAEGYAVDATDDGEQGSYLARTNEYDLIILDNNLPKKNGVMICSEVRRDGLDIPIIILSVDVGIDKKVLLLETGADDYMTKPFSFRELHARIKALLRRPKNVLQDMLAVKDFSIDIAKQKAYRGKKEIYLTRKEFGMVEYLMRHRGTVVSRGALMEHVWDMNNDPFSNTIETHILNLRKKIDKDSKYKLITTVPGRGYMID